MIKHSTVMIHASMTVWVLGHRVKEKREIKQIVKLLLTYVYNQYMKE